VRWTAHRFARVEYSFSLEETLWLTSSFCALHRTAFDPALFAQRYPAPISQDSLEQASEDLGLCFEHRACALEAALAWRLPLAVRIRAADNVRTPSAETELPDAAAATEWALVLNVGESHAAILERGATAPTSIPVTELSGRYAGSALSLVPRPCDRPGQSSVSLRALRAALVRSRAAETQAHLA
jgi:hypothetical protein